MRCFVGIEVPEWLSIELSDACAEIRVADESWRGEKWTLPANLHVTLAFLGSIPDPDVAALEEKLGLLMATQPTCELPLLRLAAIPNARRCSMVWAEFLDPSGRCGELAAGVSAVGAEFGSVADERPFRAHVTLARARRKKPLHPGALQRATESTAHGSPVMSVLSATLFSSTLTRQGPVYQALRTWPLNARQG